MRKKSQGLSITTIIVAAIALIVLVVLIAIFTGRIGGFSKGLSTAGTCESFGGKCFANPCGIEGHEFSLRIYGTTDCGKDLREEGGKNQEYNSYCCKKP